MEFVRLTNENLDLWIKNNNKSFCRIEDVKGIKIKIEFECNVDGYRWKSRPRDIKNGTGCPRCSKKERITNQNLDLWIKENNKFFRRIGDVVNAFTKIEFECELDGYRWKVSPNKIKNCNHGCPKCHYITDEKVDEWINNQGKSFRRIEHVKGSLIKIEFECKIDGYRWKTTPGNIMRLGTGCLRCFRNKKRSENEIYCFETLKKIYPHLKFEPNNLEVLKGKSLFGNDLEIDIRVQDQYYQDILYIEWNGIYWHKKYSRNYDQLKKELLGDKLIQILDPGGPDKSFVESVIYEQIVPRLGPPKDYDLEDISEYFK